MPPKHANARTIAQILKAKKTPTGGSLNKNAASSSEQIVSQSSRPQRNVSSVYRRATASSNITTANHDDQASDPTIGSNTSTSIIIQRPANNAETPTRFAENNRSRMDNIVNGRNEEIVNTEEDINDSGKKGNRKPTKLGTFRPPSGQTHTVTWREGQPISDSALQLSEELGYYARIGRLFPLNKHWDDASRETMDDIMGLLEENFIWESADEDPENPELMLPVNIALVEHWCTVTVQAAVRGWRNKIKAKYYKKWKRASPRQRALFRPERITRSEWEDLVEYIEKPEKEEEAIRNTSNVKQKKLRHCLGQRSMARTKRKLRSEGDDDFDVFIKSHKKKLGIGDYPDDETRKLCEKVIKRKEELKEQLRGSDPSTISHRLKLSSVLDEVAGRHHGGYERGYGAGYLTRPMTRRFYAPYNVGRNAVNGCLQAELDSANQLIKDMQADIQQRAEEAEREKAQERKEREEMRKQLEEFRVMLASRGHN